MESFICLIISLFFYLIIFLSLYGWGALLSLILKINLGLNIFVNAWLGLTVLITLTHIVHFYYPINYQVSFLLLIPGILLFFIQFIYNINVLVTKIKKNKQILIIYGLLLLFIAGLLAKYAMQIPTNYDSGLYHFNSINWINEFPIVRGLGNLYSPLGYNQPFFSFVALLNIYPFYNHGHNIANSFILLLVISELLLHTIYFFSRITEFNSWSSSKLLAVFMLPIVLFFITSVSISSPSPDYSANAIALILFFYFIRFVEFIKIDSLEKTFSKIKVIFIIALLGAIWKLTIVVFVFLIALLSLILLIIKTKNLFFIIKKLTTTFFYFIFVLIVWVIRGYLLTGAPMFPSTFLWYSFIWSVPKEKSLEILNTASAWARWNGRPPVEEIIRNWDWLIPWIKIHIKDRILTWFILFFCSSVCFNTFLLLFKRRKIRVKSILLIGYIPILCGLLFWFFTAPNLRFGMYLFALLMLYSLPNICFVFKSDNTRIVLFVLCILISFFPFMRTFNFSNIINSYGYRSIPVAKLQKFTNTKGFTYSIPLKGNQCFDSPLPAAPNKSENISLIGTKLEEGIQYNSK